LFFVEDKQRPRNT